VLSDALSLFIANVFDVRSCEDLKNPRENDGHENRGSWDPVTPAAGKTRKNSYARRLSSDATEEQAERRYERKRVCPTRRFGGSSDTVGTSSRNPRVGECKQRQ